MNNCITIEWRVVKKENFRMSYSFVYFTFKKTPSHKAFRHFKKKKKLKCQTPLTIRSCVAPK